jgi:glycosyltransferase involved in cell wall biosynthesis
VIQASESRCIEDSKVRTEVKISIVTLSLNQRPYLEEALESVLSQGYSHLEYIVVDPGSTDGSRELILSYGNRIAATIFEPDGGAAEGLNKGFARATGQVFGFLNADDILFPGSLNRVAEFFRSHPECDMAMGNGYKIDGQGRKTRHYIARDFSARRFFYGGTHWLQQSTFFRPSIFNRSKGFNVENRTSWDGELFLKIAELGAKIGYIDADLSGFRIHEQSISGSGRLNEQYLEDRRRMFRQLKGREWNTRDEILSLLFRMEGFLKRICM